MAPLRPGMIPRSARQYLPATPRCWGDPHSGRKHLNLYEVAEEIAHRLGSIFLRDQDGRRPVYGGTRKFQKDPHWRDLLLFYEYFHGDNGAGLGASHQTGWTGVIARLMHLFATSSPKEFLERGRVAAIELEGEPRGPTPRPAGGRGR